MTKEEFIDQIWDKRIAFETAHGCKPSTIEIPLEVEMSIAKFASYDLSESVRTSHKKILGYAVKWDSVAFEFTTPKPKKNQDPPDRKNWEKQKF